MKCHPGISPHSGTICRVLLSHAQASEILFAFTFSYLHPFGNLLFILQDQLRLCLYII